MRGLLVGLAIGRRGMLVLARWRIALSWLASRARIRRGRLTVGWVSGWPAILAWGWIVSRGLSLWVTGGLAGLGGLAGVALGTRQAANDAGGHGATFRTVVAGWISNKANPALYAMEGGHVSPEATNVTKVIA